jgi:hypothetical protein
MICVCFVSNISYLFMVMAPFGTFLARCHFGGNVGLRGCCGTGSVKGLYSTIDIDDQSGRWAENMVRCGKVSPVGSRNEIYWNIAVITPA